jgi:CHAD domain-containing protein
VTIDAAALRVPVHHGARIVALSYLADADDASKRLAGAERDGHALHDFRVAIRRLRSWIRAFDDELSAVDAHDRKTLRRIAQATNAGRDAEVQLEWLASASGGVGKRRKQGAAWMRALLEVRKQRADETMLEDVGRYFPRLQARLSRMLDVGDTAAAFQPVETPRTESLAIAISGRMPAAIHELQHRLDAVYSITDNVASHEARIAAKRLRYLIEPAAPHVKHGDELLDRLKALQDDLGVLHDLHVTAEELVALTELSSALEARRKVAEALGLFGSCFAVQTMDAHAHIGPLTAAAPAPAGTLIALAERLRADLDAAFARAHERWLEGRHREMADSIAAFAERLRIDFAA